MPSTPLNPRSVKSRFPTVRLDQVLHQVLVEVNRELPASLVLTQTKWPAQRVRPEIRDIARASLLLLVDMAGSVDARLDLRATATADGGLKLRFSLFLPEPAGDPEPAGGRPLEHDEGPLELLRQMGGDVRLEVCYPYVCLGLRLPL